MILFALLAAVQTPAVSAESPLSLFVGKWGCDGHFEPSKRPLAADLDFVADAATGAMIKQHRDRAPSTFVASETWSCAAPAKRFRAAIADKFGGLR